MLAGVRMLFSFSRTENDNLDHVHAALNHCQKFPLKPPRLMTRPIYGSHAVKRSWVTVADAVFMFTIHPPFPVAKDCSDACAHASLQTAHQLQSVSLGNSYICHVDIAAQHRGANAPMGSSHQKNQCIIRRIR